MGRVASSFRYWAHHLDQSLTRSVAKRLRPQRAAQIVRALEEVGQPLEIDLLGPDPQVNDMDLEVTLLDPERVLKLPEVGRNLPGEVLAWSAIRGFRVSGSSLDLNSGLAFSGTQVITQSGIGHRWVRDAAFITGALRRIEGQAVTKIAGDVASLGASSNYYHMLIEFLPRLLRLRALMPTITFVANGQAPGLLREIDPDLAERVRVIEPDTVIQPERLWMITPQPLFAPHPDDLNYLRREYSPPSQSDDSVKRRIFVSRNQDERVGHAEEMLRQTLDERGFSIVDFAALSWREQVERAASTRILVGVHGAGLSNMIFMPPGGHVVEITDGKWWFPCYRRMAHALSLTYTRIVVDDRGTSDVGGLVASELDRLDDE